MSIKTFPNTFITMKALLLLLTFCFSINSFCQIVKIVDEQVISGDIKFPHNEPHQIVNPTNDNHLILAAILTENWEEGFRPDSYIILLQSRDRGLTWQDNIIDLGFDHDRQSMVVDPTTQDFLIVSVKTMARL